MNAVSPESIAIRSLLGPAAASPRATISYPRPGRSVIRDLRLSRFPRGLRGDGVPLGPLRLPQALEALPGAGLRERLPGGQPDEDLLAELPPQPVELDVHPPLLLPR